MPTPLRLLIVGDSEEDARTLLHELEQGDFEVRAERVKTAPSLAKMLDKGEFDLIIADYTIPGFGGLPALNMVRERGIDIPFLMTTPDDEGEIAREVMQAGARDLIVKGRYARLIPAVSRELNDYRLRKEQEKEVVKQSTEADKQRQLAFTMIKQNPQPLVLMKKNFDIKLVNDAFIALSGYTEQDLLKMNAHSFKVLEKTSHGIREAIETKKGVSGEVKIEFPTGVHFVEQHVIPLLDRDTNIVSIMIAYNDLTEKKAKDVELMKQMESITRLQKQSEAMIRENPLAIAIFRADRSILDFNKEYENLWQASREELLQKGLTDFNVKTVKGEDYYASFETKNEAISELEVILRDGTRRFLTLYQVPVLNSSGEIEVNYYFYVDLTPQRELERYQGTFIRTLVENMKRLGSGDFQLDLAVEPHGIYTRDAHDRFIEINKNLGLTRDAIGAMIQDTQAISDAVVQGRLNVRASVARHQGDYAKVIAGVNKVMESIAVPIKESLRVSQEYAKTNFTARFDPRIEVAGEWVEFREALNNIGISVSHAVNLVNQQFLDLAAAAEEANASIEEVTSGASQIARSVGGVSHNSERGRDGIHQILKAMEDLTATVSDVSIKAESVSKLAGESNILSRKGEELATKAENGMLGITKNTEEVFAIVNDIKGQMDQIGKIVGVITDLANQTNLLALNAAIEAARAGDAGRGFAVVATEVKSLAQESRMSAQNIAEMINTLQQKTIKASDAVNGTTKTVREGSSALSQTLQVFKNIAESIEHISRNMEEVAGASEEQAASVEEITASVNEVSSLINNTAMEAERSAEGSEQTAAAINQVALTIGNLNTISEKVSSAMAKFRV